MLIKTDKPLGQLLSDYASENNEEARTSIESAIWKQFGTTGAILVLDMSGFSVVTRTRGIVYYMSLIYKMQQAVAPAIAMHKGNIVKFEADNCFATFTDSDNALSSALAIHDAIAEINARNPDDRSIEVSIGIDHGRYLSLGSIDFFGDPVNLASKLGEDLAEANEILMTRESHESLTDSHPVEFIPVEFSISGLKMDAVRVKRI